MTIGTIKLTPAQQLLINALLSILGSAVTAGMTAIYQAYSTQGLNVGVLLNVGLVTFLAFFGKSLYDFVPGHIQQTIQALQDSVEELRLTLHITTSTQPVITPSIQPTSVAASQPSPVTIHISGGTTAPTIPTVTIQDTPTALKSTPTLASVSQSINSAATVVDMGPIAPTPIDEEDTEVRPAIKQVL